MNVSSSIYSCSNTIGIFSSPRSGSTWLTEILNLLPETAVLYEPLNTGDRKNTNGQMPSSPDYYLKDVSDLSFYHYQPIPANASWIKAEQFFHLLFNRAITPPHLYWGNNEKQIIKARHLIIKFCYGNLLLPWINKNFDISTIALIRHPCAVVNSQLNTPGWEEIIAQPRYLLPRFKHDDIFTRYESIISSINTPEENLAATWAINWVDILKSNNDKRLLIHYENLVIDGNNTVNKIFQYLKTQVPNEAVTQLKVPSKTTFGLSRTLINNQQQLGQWKKQLSTRQIKRVLDIIRKFDIHDYTDSLLPEIYSD